HQLPDALLVLVGRAVSRPDQGHHVSGENASVTNTGRQSRRRRSAADQQPPPAELEAARAHQLFFSASRTRRPGFIRPKSRSTICPAPWGVRRSPKEIPGTSLPARTTLNHTTSPVRRSTRPA